MPGTHMKGGYMLENTVHADQVYEGLRSICSPVDMESRVLHTKVII